MKCLLHMYMNCQLGRGHCSLVEIFFKHNGNVRRLTGRLSYRVNLLRPSDAYTVLSLI